jgi:hypothetical protein
VERLLVWITSPCSSFKTLFDWVFHCTLVSTREGGAHLILSSWVTLGGTSSPATILPSLKLHRLNSMVGLHSRILPFIDKRFINKINILFQEKWEACYAHRSSGPGKQPLEDTRQPITNTL